MVSLRQSYMVLTFHIMKILCIFWGKNINLAAILDFRREGLLRVTRIAVYSIQGD